jgi:hypothetical protein
MFALGALTNEAEGMDGEALSTVELGALARVGGVATLIIASTAALSSGVTG